MNLSLRAFFVSLCVLSGDAFIIPSMYGQSTLIPLTTRRDMVFDHSGTHLYVSTSDGFVKSFNVPSGTLAKTFNVGGSLNAIDITPDDSLLLVAHGDIDFTTGTATFHKIDLTSGSITDINFRAGSDEYNTFEVAIVSNSQAFGTLGANVSDGLRQIDLQTNTVSLRTDAFQGETPIVARSPDRSHLYFSQQNGTNQVVFRYDVASDAFTTLLRSDRYMNGNLFTAVDRNGSRFASFLTGATAFQTLPGFSFLRGFAAINGGFAFAPLSDVFYGVDMAAAQIVAYDSNNLSEKFRLNIGEDQSPYLPFRFDRGNLIVSPDGHFLALSTAAGIRLFTVPSAPSATPTPSPTLASRRDMVFDHSGQFLYVTSSTGFVERYNLSAGQIDRVYDLGGKLNGVDISDDDSFLLVGQDVTGLVEGVFHRLDLGTGTVTDIRFHPRYVEPGSGGLDVAIMPNGLALVIGGQGLEQIDLSTNAITERIEPWGSIPHGSADRQHFYVVASGAVPDGHLVTYDSNTNTFDLGATADTTRDDEIAVVNRNGTLIATHIGGCTALDTAPDLHYRRSFNSLDSGLAFDPVVDRLYGISTSLTQIIAYDTTTFAEKFRLDIGETAAPSAEVGFVAENLLANRDGRYLAVKTVSGIRVLTISSPVPEPPPSPTPTLTTPRDLVFDHGGNYLYITTPEGFIHRYNILLSKIDAVYDLGGSLWGADIAPDDSFLLVAQEKTGVAESVIQKIDLTTNTVTNIPYLVDKYALGVFDVGIGGNGLAVVAGGFYNDTHVRQIDLATNSVSVLTDSSGQSREITGATEIQRSADRRLFYFSQPGGDLFVYDALNNSFGPTVRMYPVLFRSAPAVNRNGTLLATRIGRDVAIESPPNFDYVRNFTGFDIGGVAGIAFDPLRDRLYLTHTTADAIIAYDTNTFAELFRINIGEPVNGGPVLFSPGNLVPSQDGRLLALVTPENKIRLFDANATITPTPTPSPTIPIVSVSVSSSQVYEGSDVTFRVSTAQAVSQPVTIGYSFSGSAQQGADFTLSDSSGHFTIRAGDLAATLTLHALIDGVMEKNETVKLTLNTGPGYKFIRRGNKAKITILNR